MTGTVRTAMFLGAVPGTGGAIARNSPTSSWPGRTQDQEEEARC